MWPTAVVAGGVLADFWNSTGCRSPQVTGSGRLLEPHTYANICEQCDNFVTTTEFIPELQAQLADITALRDDAAEHGWDTEVARHARVIASINNHLNRLGHRTATDANT
jgi:hypothetical protein